jgi:hypothetical protein
MTSIQDFEPVRLMDNPTNRLGEIRRLAPTFRERFAASCQDLSRSKLRPMRR